MDSLMNTLQTGPIADAGDDLITLNVRTRYSKPKHDNAVCTFQVNIDLLGSSSALLVSLLAKEPDTVYIVWPDFEIVESYVAYLYDRKIHRIPEDSLSRKQYAYTVLKYPRNPLNEYSPLVRDLHLLLNLWLFGFYAKDATFMDTVMKFLQLMLVEEQEEEYTDGRDVKETFVRFMNPTVVTAIWQWTDANAKLRRFVIDTLIRYASHQALLAIYSAKIEPGQKASSSRETRASGQDPAEDSIQYAYPAEFLDELEQAQAGSTLVTSLPAHIQALYPGHVRVFKPPFGHYVDHPRIASYVMSPERLKMIEEVYGEGRVVHRSQVAGEFERESCVYRGHTADENCFLLGRKYRLGLPVEDGDGGEGFQMPF